jgi:hypothetical protein
MSKANVKPMVRIHDVEADEVIDREMTDEEFAQYEMDLANAELSKSEATAKASAKEALLTKLGITADEAALLLS